MIFFKAKQSNGLTEYLAEPHAYNLAAAGIPERKLYKITEKCPTKARARDAIWGEFNGLSVTFFEKGLKTGDFSDIMWLRVTMALFMDEEGKLPKDTIVSYLHAASVYINFYCGLQALNLAQKRKKEQVYAFWRGSFEKFPFDASRIFSIAESEGMDRNELHIFMLKQLKRLGNNDVIADYELVRALTYMNDGNVENLNALCSIVAARIIEVIGYDNNIRMTKQEMIETAELWNEYGNINQSIEKEWLIISGQKDFQSEHANTFADYCRAVIGQYKILITVNKTFKNKKNVPAYTRLVMLLEKQHEYETAAKVCCDAITVGVDMQKQLARNIGKAKREPSAQERELLGYEEI